MKRSSRKLLLIFLTLIFSLLAALTANAQSVQPPILIRESCASINADNLIPTVDCAVLMRVQASPVVSEIARDSRTLNSYSFWQVLRGDKPLYNAPGGAVIGTLPQGFNFVNVVNTSGDWVQTESGEWMSGNDVRYYQPSEFRGVTLLNGLDHPFGWVLGNLLTTEYPGGPQSLETGVLKLRYDRVNIFGEAVGPNGWVWYMVGPNQWIDQRSLAIAMPIARPEGVSGRWIAVDLYEQTAVAYEDDTPVFATLVSSGLDGWDTNEGIFEIWARPAVDGMSGATGAPDAYALQSVPWVMYFDDSISLHGTYWHDGFGYRHSHGCVNLSISDARWIFEWTAGSTPDENGEIHNQVYVYSTGIYGSNGR